MSKDVDKDFADLDSKDKQKLKKLVEKDAKAHRDPSGVWKWLVAMLGASLVLFYFYAAGIASVGTQFHLGIYVFITYILV
ncbi:MAG: hypothetical protein V2I36_12440, partial [Desulfopila sp.]|nr:hypothetical protein [Desulfopila sp.]